jgi:hypothetical protein
MASMFDLFAARMVVPQVLHTFGERDESGAYLLAVFEAPDGTKWGAKYVVAKEVLSPRFVDGDAEDVQTLTIQVESSALPESALPLGSNVTVRLPSHPRWCWSVDVQGCEYGAAMATIGLARAGLVSIQSREREP